MEIKVPELGENIEGGDVIRILVSKGDQIKPDQPVLELETGKATLEIPAPVAGRIEEIRVNVGDTVSVGQPVFTVEETRDSEPEASPKEPAPEKTDRPKTDAGTSAETPPKTTTESPPTKPGTPPAPKPKEETSPAPRTPEPEPVPPESKSDPDRTPVSAAPAVRGFAREIGIDITQVVGHGTDGHISMDDVKQFARQVATGRAIRGHCALESEPHPDFSKWGPTRRETMSKIRVVTAEHLGRAWATIPHVTQHGKADVTELEALRKRFSTRAEKAGAKLTLTAILVKIVAAALKVHPRFNASLDLVKREVHYKDYVHIGIAVDTPRGLLVPVLRDADQKNMVQIAVELGAVADQAREGKIAPDDVQGGSFTLTNLGGIGGSFFTPIINAPEVAILGVGRSEDEPRWNGQAFEPRRMLPLSLSYDHRVIDGADGARFLRWIVEAIEEPLLISL